eukprot:6909590-Prymnesium_polylepis.1
MLLPWYTAVAYEYISTLSRKSTGRGPNNMAHPLTIHDSEGLHSDATHRSHTFFGHHAAATSITIVTGGDGGDRAGHLMISTSRPA